MAVPKRKTSNTKKGTRRSHHAKKHMTLTACPRCKTAIPTHVACPNCGTYKGRVVIDVIAKLNKKERKNKARARQAQ